MADSIAKADLENLILELLERGRAERGRGRHSMAHGIDTALAELDKLIKKS